MKSAAPVKDRSSTTARMSPSVLWRPLASRPSSCISSARTRRARSRRGRLNWRTSFSASGFGFMPFKTPGRWIQGTTIFRPARDGEPVGRQVIAALTSEALQSWDDLEQLYLRYSRSVYRRARELLVDDEAARDATQEVFMRVIRAGGKCRSAPDAHGVAPLRDDQFLSEPAAGSKTPERAAVGNIRPDEEVAPNGEARAALIRDPEPRPRGAARDRGLFLPRRADVRRNRPADRRVAANGEQPFGGLPRSGG